MVLEDHKKEGKRFVPKLKRGKVPLGEIQYCDTILPEIFWMTYILDKFGDEKGFNLVAKFLKLVHEIESWEKHPEFSMVSYFGILSESQKQTVIQILEAEKVLDEIRSGIAPFIRVFSSDNPLSFLVPDEVDKEPTDDDLDLTIRILEETVDRWSVRGTILQSLVVHYSFDVGKVTVPSDMELPNFEAIFTDFESTEGSMAAGFVRCTVSQTFMFHTEHGPVDSQSWCETFWNAGNELLEYYIGTEINLDESSSDYPPHVFQAKYGTGCMDLLGDFWRKLPKTILHCEEAEVIGALVSRQCELTLKFAKNLDLWDWQIGPLLLRTMTDCHIALAWILADPLDRSRKFIDHGLGQEKLIIEHYKTCLDECTDDEDRQGLAAMIANREKILNSQHFSFLQDVNIGSWSGISTRAMAEDVDCLDLYRFAYTPYSFCAHNTWNHIGVFNCAHSDNPLHKFLRQPCVRETSVEPSAFMNSAKYYEKSLNTVAKKYNFEYDEELLMPWNLAAKHMDELVDWMRLGPNKVQEKE